jgi:hypothetical protein
MYQPALTSSTNELEQILLLQKNNLLQHVGETERQSEGFVTLQHSLPILIQLHGLAPSVIIKDNNTVIAYALTMLNECRQLVPNLESMYAIFDKLTWKSSALSNHRFYVMGQVCIAKGYRGQGLFEMMYQHHKKIFQPQFDLLVTEIATRNRRSMRAHEKVGFQTLHTHKDELDEWAVVGWDWK